MKYIYWLLIMLCPAATYAQNAAGVTALAPGDNVPDIPLYNLYNYPQPSASLAAFKNKLVLLDFWATSCASCVAAMDHLQQLQNNFNTRLQVLLVSTAGNGDTPQRINNLFKKLATGDGTAYSLPVITADTALSAYFPYKYLPHIVWLGNGQKVLAITGPEEVTEANITAVLSGHPPAFRYKEDLFGFNTQQGLFKNGNAGSGNNFLFRSIITPYVVGIPSSSHTTTDSTGKVTGISHANSTLLMLLRMAYNLALPPGHINTDAAGATLKYTSGDDQWIVNNSYCYDLVCPPVAPGTALLYMQQDLQRYFNLTATIEERVTDCYLLTADTVTLNRFASGSTISASTLFDKTGKACTNCSMQRLTEYFDLTLPLPVINETNSLVNINIRLPDKEPQSIPALNKALLHYGLRLTPAKRKAALFIITNHLPNPSTL